MHPNLACKCFNVHERLCAHEFAWPFLEPVDPIALNLPTYFEEVKTPMDLRTMKHKLEQNMYATPYEYRRDMVLMFENAILFNRKDTRENSVSNLAKKLLKFGLEALQQSFSSEGMHQSDNVPHEMPNLSTNPEIKWTEQITNEILDQAMKQNLWQHWKKHSFVARMNRIKIGKAREPQESSSA